MPNAALAWLADQMWLSRDVDEEEVEQQASEMDVGHPG